MFRVSIIHVLDCRNFLRKALLDKQFVLECALHSYKNDLVTKETRLKEAQATVEMYQSKVMYVICIYTYTYIHIQIHIYIYRYIYTYTDTYIPIQIHIYIYIYTYTDTCIYTVPYTFIVLTTYEYLYVMGVNKYAQILRK